jgi:hypothetical protein
MRHEEALYKAPEYRTGRLSPAERAEVDRHLKGCAECRSLFAAWRLEEPSIDLTAAVMRDLGRVVVLDREREPQTPFWGRAQWWGAVAAALLIGLVFYRPEREWTDADRSFAWLDSNHLESSAPAAPWKEGSHE